MTFSSTTLMAPSGEFVSAKGYSEGVPFAGEFLPIYNPGIVDEHRNSFEVTRSFDYGSDEWVANLSKFKCRVEVSQFDLYGEQIISLTQKVQSYDSHCSLGPIRGAAKPCTLVEVMNRGSVEYDFFNYQCGSQPENHSRVLADVKEILLLRDPEVEDYRINITDAAKGGYGINALTSVLREIKESTPQFAKQRWHLGVDLLHDSSADVSRIEDSLKWQVPGSFEIDLQRYEVPNLIFEDYDPALAVDLQSAHGRYLFKPCAQPGKMLLREGEEVFVVETENAGLMLDELVSQSVTENLVTSPEHTQVGNVWEDYMNKE